MNIQAGISNAGLFLTIIIAIVLAIVYLIYYHKKDKDEFTAIQRYILSGIRFIYLIIISILILSPLIETIKRRIEKPILVIGVDNSESMALNDENSKFVVSALNELTSSAKNKFDIQQINFGKEAKTNVAPDFKDKISNYSDFIDEVDKRFYNLNVGAVVLVGDGIFNEGKNPIENVTQIQAPIYTIGLGDTLTRFDQAITNVSHNTNVFLGNTFPIEIETNFTNFTQSKSQLTVYVAGKIAYSEVIEIPQPDFFYKKTINIQSEKIGVQNITVQLTPVSNEENTENNRYSFVIEVHDNKYQVLFLTDAPHPDIGALSETLKKQSNFNLTTKTLNDFNGEIKEYNLIVINQLPSLKLQQSDVFKKIIDSDIALLILVGPNTALNSLNNFGLNFNIATATATQESSPYFNESFTQFSIPANIKDVATVYPPLLTYYTKYEFGSEYAALAYQKINGVEMNIPLIMVGEVNSRKVGMIAGEGIWRWKLYEFQNNENHEVFDQIVVNMFNYLCLKELKEQFRVDYKRITPEISPVKIKAQVLNEIYEPITTAEVKLILKDSAGSEFNYLFDPSNLEYNLNLGFLNPGEYSFVASTKIGEKEFSKTGNFHVEEINIEQQNNKANFILLNSISQKTGGKFYTKENWQNLLQTLNQNPDIKVKTHNEKSIIDLINWKWLMIIILLFLSLEWFLRKFWGSY